MAGVIGPNCYKPGHRLAVPVGMKCDEHEVRDATYRIVGETDSFGSELIDMCDECYSTFRGEEAARTGTCHFCKQVSEVSYFRDPAEGSCGPVYDACSPCGKKIIDDFIGDD